MIPELKDGQHSVPTVVVGMSGGVDSSVAALLLKAQGYRVIGIFMKNWEEGDEEGCQAAQDFEDVALVCQQIGIPFYSVNFAKEYWNRVFSRCLTEFRAGFTPNPDILCNSEIKFRAFFDKVMELGADYLATGHYCQTKVVDGEPWLLRGSDTNKDQSYFLYAINGQVLRKVLFPIGHLPKIEVRRIAREHGLATASKKDSTGICFIGKRNFKDFLSQYVPPASGDFVNLQGQVVGKHDGVSFYTIGQRKGLKIGGPGDAWFVVGKDIDKNIVIIDQGASHDALYDREVIATESSWISIDRPKTPFRCTAKIRYRQADSPCTIISIDDERLMIQFDEPQRAITPRQSIVFYDGERCLGGALIAAS